MRGLIRRCGRGAKDLTKNALRAAGARPELDLELRQLQIQVDANTRQIEDLERKVAALTQEFEPLRAVMDELSGHGIPWSHLSGTVAQLSDKAQGYEQELRALERRMERFGGHALGEMALERRLRRIEDRLSDNGE